MFWLDATSVETAEDSFLRIAHECHQEENFESIKTWLSRKDNWLLIIDNADDPELEISRFLPMGNRGTVLITTRNPDLRHLRTSDCSYHVQEMSDKDATELLLKLAAIGNGHGGDDTAKISAAKIVKALGYLALAINQAGAVIGQGLCSLDGFCDVYSKQKKELLESGRSQPQPGIEYRYSVYTTWEISIGRIEKMTEKHAALALELLRLFSFMHFDGISENIFKRARERHRKGSSSVIICDRSVLFKLMPLEWNQVLMGQALALLISLSLVSVDHNRQISMHPLVHEWSRDRIPEKERQEACLVATVILGMSGSLDYTLTDQQHRRLLLPHIDACLASGSSKFLSEGPDLEERLFIALIFSTAYDEMLRCEKALDLWLNILKQLPLNHLYRFPVLSRVGSTLLSMRRFRESAEHFRSMLKESSASDNRQGMFAAMFGIAHAIHELGEHQKAVDMCKDAILK